jgi:hypothetical protein
VQACRAHFAHTNKEVKPTYRQGTPTGPPVGTFGDNVVTQSPQSLPVCQLSKSSLALRARYDPQADFPLPWASNRKPIAATVGD